MRFIQHCLLSLATVMAACSSSPDAIAPPSLTDCSAGHDIHVVSHGWHTGIIIEAAALDSRISALKARFPQSRYYEIGWGDAGFYQANEITFGLALQALFASTGSVLHVVGIDQSPQQRFAHSKVRTLSINGEGFANLLRYLRSSFAYTKNGNIIALKRGLYGDSEFYAASGTFHAFNTCNTWTAKALYSAGIDISPTFRLTADSVMRKIDSQRHVKGDTLNPCNQ